MQIIILNILFVLIRYQFHVEFQILEVITEFMQG